MLGVVDSVKMHSVWPDIASASGCALFQQYSHESQVILTLEAPKASRTEEGESRFTTHFCEGRANSWALGYKQCRAVPLQKSQVS